MDILAQVIKPEGAYIWPMLGVMVLGGAITGFVWGAVKNVSSRRLRIIFVIFCTSLAIFGAFNHRVLWAAEQNVWYTTLLRLKGQLPFATWGMYAASLLGIIFLAFDIILEKKHPSSYNGNFLQLVVTVFTSDIVVTTLNTFVLRAYYEGLAKLPFWMVYIPRLIPDFVSTVIFAYLLSFLLKIHSKYTSNL